LATDDDDDGDEEEEEEEEEETDDDDDDHLYGPDNPLATRCTIRRLARCCISWRGTRGG
jgi:hypothetical protein